MKSIFQTILTMILFATGGGWQPATQARASDLVSCAISQESGKIAEEVTNGEAVMVITMLIEKDGTHIPQFDTPKEPCALDKFQIDNYQVHTQYSSFTKGHQTLLYRFVASKADERREIVVLYSGMASFVDGKTRFFMAETIGHSTSIIALYDNQPSLDLLKEKLTGILNGTTEPLIAFEWAKDTKELVINKYNAD